MRMAAPGFDLTGKAVLVTGGNSGIGLGMADALAAAGADVAIWGVKPERNASAAERLRRHGRRVHAALCDVSDESAVERAMAETLAALGRLDACFANAGVSGRAHKTLAEMTTAEWYRIDTPLTTQRINTPEFAAEMMPRHPIARWGVPEDFGGIAVFLAGDASKWTTGATFVIDGGYTVAAKVAT